LLHAGAQVPQELCHHAFLATPLTTANVALDYAAYMASPEVIRAHSAGQWPVDGFTLDHDRAQVARHQAAHEAHRAFAFLLLDPSESEALGCLYLNPLHPYLSRAGAAPEVQRTFPSETAIVTFWIHQDHQDTGLAALVAEGVNTWLQTAWPFATHLFRILPGEQSSRSAVEGLHVRRLSLRLPGEERPYLWYQPL